MQGQGEVLVLQCPPVDIHQASVAQGGLLAGGQAGVTGLLTALRIGADMAQPAFEHAVFLKRVGSYLELHALVGVSEANVCVGQPDLGLQRGGLRHQACQDGAGLDDGAHGVGGELFYNPIARCAQE